MNPSGRYPPPAAVPRWPGWPGWCWRAWLLWAMVPAALAQGECPPVARPPTAAQAQAAQRQAVDRGLLWRFSRDGRDGFLFGTIHIGRFEWAFPGPTLRSVLAASDTLALEVDLSDPEDLRQFARSAATAGSSR